MLSLSVSSTCSTAGGDRELIITDYTAAYVTLCSWIKPKIIQSVLYLHLTITDNIRSFLNVQLKCI